jgi:hypothetical protein
MRGNSFLEKIKALYNLEKPSLLILILPYIAISWNEIYNIGFFTYSKLGLTLFSLVLFDLTVKMVTKKKNKINFYLVPILIALYVLFFYGVMFLIPSVNLLFIKTESLNIRPRWFFVFYFLVIVFVQLFFLKKNKKVYIYLNSYSIFLFFIVMGTNTFKKEELAIKNINEIKNKPITLKVVDTIQKPILLIITDEYASPDEIYKVVKDSSIYNYSNNLQKKGWITKNHFYSYETSTINSLSSLFNFNLSTTNEYSRQLMNTVVVNKLLKCDLYDSIYKKKGQIINYGIFDVGNTKPFTRLYNYPENFTEQLLLNSCFSFFVKKAELLNTLKNGIDSYPSENHTQKIFKRIKDEIKEKKSLLYVHFLMPHSPFVYNPEFKYRKENTLNYIAYWNFTNKKLIGMLNNLTKQNKYSIILTGDHGYRKDKRMNPHNTFTAFWGFDAKDIDKIHSVQDLGSLINGYVF